VSRRRDPAAKRRIRLARSLSDFTAKKRDGCYLRERCLPLLLNKPRVLVPTSPAASWLSVMASGGDGESGSMGAQAFAFLRRSKAPR
jgi:hypothetical protein